MAYEEFATLIRKKRDEQQMSQNQLATICGLKRSAIVNIEMGKQRIFLDQALKLAFALKISLEDIQKIFQTEIFKTHLATHSENIQKLIHNTLENFELE